MGNCFAPEKGGPEPDAEPAFARIERLERAAADAMPAAEEGVPVSLCLPAPSSVRLPQPPAPSSVRLLVHLPTCPHA